MSRDVNALVLSTAGFFVVVGAVRSTWITAQRTVLDGSQGRRGGEERRGRRGGGQDETHAVHSVAESSGAARVLCRESAPELILVYAEGNAAIQGLLQVLDVCIKESFALGCSGDVNWEGGGEAVEEGRGSGAIREKAPCISQNRDLREGCGI